MNLKGTVHKYGANVDTDTISYSMIEFHSNQ